MSHYQTSRLTSQVEYFPAAIIPGLNAITMIATLLQSFSRGTVKIASADISVLPTVDSNLLSDPRDKETAVAAFRCLRNIAAAMTTVLPTEISPGVNITSDEDILSAIEASAGIIFHASCTCKMGLANDSMAVVDSQHRVFGGQNLRVCDASSFWKLPPGQPQATVYALAEKLASNILEF